jgi:hypothetical protein
MNSIDLQNAFEPGRKAEYFMVLLLRLIAKADGSNREQLREGFPVEVKAVEIYRRDFPYANADRTVVDWDKIEERAKSATYLPV